MESLADWGKAFIQEFGDVALPSLHIYFAADLKNPQEEEEKDISFQNKIQTTVK